MYLSIPIEFRNQWLDLTLTLWSYVQSVGNLLWQKAESQIFNFNVNLFACLRTFLKDLIFLIIKRTILDSLTE